MPRPGRPGNRESIEGALLPMQAAVLADLCTQLGIDPARWHTSPLLRVFVMAGVLNLADELHLAGSSREHALMSAGVRCGVPFETVKTWRRRARSVQDEPAAPSGVAA